MDNIFIERLWRSLKYEAVYLHELTDGFKAERVIRDWIVRRRPRTNGGLTAHSTTPSGLIPLSVVERRSRPTGPGCPWI
jgi:transposase InsO family protein